MIGSNLETRTFEILKPASNYRWIAILLCAATTFISHLDRVNLAVATPTLMKTFNISSTQMGVLMSAFFWTYVLCAIPAGALLNRIGSKIVLGWSCLAWGLTTMLTALVSGYYSFFVVRILLGATEAPGFPSCVRVVSVWIPERERTRATAMFNCSTKLGIAITPPMVVWIILQWGWQASFVITGGIAVAYSFVWWCFYHEPDDHPKVTQSELAYIRQDEVVNEAGKVEKTKLIPLLQLFTYRQMLLVYGGFFSFTYFFSLFSTWIPAYLVLSKGFNLKEMGVAAMFPWLVGAFMELLGGYCWDKWQQHGATLNQVRRTGMAVCLLGGALFMYLAVKADSPTLIMTFLTVSMGVFAFGCPNSWAIPNDLAPYGQGGGVAGTMNAVGQTAGVLSPIITGFVIGTSWGYEGALFICCAITGIGAVLYMLNDYKRLVPKN